MEKFHNIEEQRFWNNSESFSLGGDEWSARFGTTQKLWDNLLSEKVKKYCTGTGLEIAPGEGRITKYLLDECNSLSLVELNELPLSKCVEKFGKKIDGYFVNDGKTLPAHFNNNLDFIFSFDSFVHIHQNVFFDYIKEMSRCLKNGGYAVIHHSHFSGGTDFSFNNLGGRANLNFEELQKNLEDNSFELISSEECTVSIWFDDLQDLIGVFRKI